MFGVSIVVVGVTTGVWAIRDYIPDEMRVVEY